MLWHTHNSNTKLSQITQQSHKYVGKHSRIKYYFKSKKGPTDLRMNLIVIAGKCGILSPTHFKRVKTVEKRSQTVKTATTRRAWYLFYKRLAKTDLGIQKISEYVRRIPKWPLKNGLERNRTFGTINFVFGIPENSTKRPRNNSGTPKNGWEHEGVWKNTVERQRMSWNVFEYWKNTKERFRTSRKVSG